MTVALWADNIMELKGSGMAYHQRNLLHALDRRGNDDYLAVYTTHRREDAAGVPAFARVRTKRLPHSRRVLYPAWHALQRPRIDRHLEGARLVHLLGSAVTVPSALPRIVWVVDIASLRLPETFSTRRRIFKRAALRRAARDPTVTFTANTQFVKDDMCDLFDIDPARVEVVWLGVDHDRFNPGAAGERVERVRAAMGLDQPFFLFVSMLSPRKNADVLIEGFARFKQRTGAEHRLVLAGSRGWDYERVLELAQRTPDVQLAGFVADEDLPALYAAAEAFVFPSSHEGFGLPALEAMAAGTPVISSAVTAMPEVIGDAGVLLEAISADAVAGALERVAGDAQLRDDLRRRGLDRARGFTWDATAAKCERLYAERAAAL